MPELALAIKFRSEILADPTMVVEELDRTYARLNGHLAGLGQNNPEKDVESGIDPGSGVSIGTFTDLQGPFILTGTDLTLSSDAASLDPGDVSVLRITASGATRTIQGIRGGVDRRILIIYAPRDATEILTLAHNSGSADTDKRIDLIGAAALSSVASEARGWILQYDGANKRWVQLGGSAAIAAVATLDVDTTEVNVADSTDETSVYSFSVPANTLSAGKILRLTLKGMYQKTAGAGSAFAVKVTFGGTTLVSGNIATGLGSVANKRSTRVTCEIAAVAADDQRAMTRVNFGNVAGGSATWESLLTDSIGYHDGLSLDLTTALTLDVLVTHGVADAGISFKKDMAIIEVD